MTVSTVYYRKCFHDAVPEVSVVQFYTSSHSQILAKQVYDWILNFPTAVL